MQPIRVAATSSQADEWALVHTAAGITNAVEPDEDGWAVLAAGDDAVRAQAALAAYDQDRRADAAIPAAIEPYPWMSGVAAGLLLLWLFSVTGPPDRFERGAAVAGRIMGGELWRAVTALTLHVDMVHASGNAVAIAVLLPPLVQRSGAGLALLLLVLTGALGNVLAASVHDARHVAVGASTAIFGAVGILAAAQVTSGARPTRAKRWIAPVAGVVLLVMLGAAPRSDLAAHALGFAVGGVVGLVAGRMPKPRAIVQWALGGLAVLVVGACWYAAFRA